MPTMTDLFPSAAAVILESEGVFSDLRNDPGGSTYFGIARASHPDIPWPPTKDQALAIYRSQYWDPHRCGEMPWAWALAVFDGVVNQDLGVLRLAQLALRITEDGAIGSATIHAMGAAPADDFGAFLSLRADAYYKSHGYPAFGHGWFARLIRVAQAGEHPPVAAP